MKVLVFVNFSVFFNIRIVVEKGKFFSLVTGAMIRIFKVKEKQKEDAENSIGGVPVKKQSAGELRLQKGLSSALNGFIFSFMLVLTLSS